MVVVVPGSAGLHGALRCPEEPSRAIEVTARHPGRRPPGDLVAWSEIPHAKDDRVHHDGENSRCHLDADSDRQVFRDPASERISVCIHSHSDLNSLVTASGRGSASQYPPATFQRRAGERSHQATTGEPTPTDQMSPLRAGRKRYRRVALP